jgi:hypothetical protein
MTTLIEVISKNRRDETRGEARQLASQLIVPLISIDQLQQLEEAGYDVG